MAIKLCVSLTEGKGQTLSEWVYDKDKIAMGRAPESELLLVDTDGHVSRTHAVIMRSDSGYEILDFGSRNGTYVNDLRIESSVKSPIRAGDVVRIGPYSIKVDSTTADRKAAVNQSRLIYHDHLTKRVAELDAKAILEGNIPTAPPPPEPPTKPMEKRPSLSMKAPSEQEIAVKRPTAPIPDADPPTKSGKKQTKVRQELPSGKTDAVSGEGVEAVLNASYKVVTRLSQHFLGDSSFTTPEQVEVFGKLIEQTLEVMLDWLMKCLKGRGEFEEQFEAYVTMAYKRTKNPIKQVKDQLEVRRFSLDWRGTPDMEKVKHSLEGAFRDLGEHQMGMIAGVQEAVAAILRRIDPETLEHQALASAKGLGKTFAKMSLAKRSWQLYSTTYRDLLAESTKLFNDVIFPSIRKGYLQSHSREEKKGDTGAKAEASKRKA